MAIIYSYPQGSSALQEDRVIITRIGEEENKITTKQLTLGQIGDYIITANDVVTGTGTPNNIPMWGSDGGSIVDSPIHTEDTKVGIGTTDPSESLDVIGNILATGTILGSNLSGTNTGDQVLPTDFVSAANGGTFGGDIFASNLSGTNTGDQDLSGFTSNILSENVSFGESYASKYNSIVIGDGGTFFPRPLGYEIGLMKEQESFNKTTLSLLPSGVGVGKVYNIKPKNKTLSFGRFGDGTYIDEDGVLQQADSEVPRIDYSIVNGVVSNHPSLLLEPSKINKFKQSRNLSDSEWAKSNVTIDENQLIGLEKELTVDKIVETASNNPHLIYQGAIPKLSIPGNNAFQTLSGYFIPAERTVVGIQITDNLNNLIRVYVNLINLEVVDKLVVGFQEDRIIIERFNEFVFVSVTAKALGASNSYIGRILLAESKDNTSVIYQGVAGHGLYATSLQFEDGVYPTTRINTTDTWATRNPELCYSVGIDQYFNPDKGGFYIELDKIRVNTENANITFNDFTTETEFRIFTERNSQRLRFYIMNGGVMKTNGITSVPYDTDSKNKIAFYWNKEVGKIKLFINGEYIVEAEYPEDCTSYQRFSFSRGNGTEVFYGRVNALSLYDGKDDSLSDQFFINTTKQ